MDDALGEAGQLRLVHPEAVTLRLARLRPLEKSAGAALLRRPFPDADEIPRPVVWLEHLGT